MAVVDFLRMLALSALWGGSFVFMRVLTPALGIVVASDARLLTGGLVLLGWLAAKGFDTEWRRFWRVYLGIGIIASALPFLLYSYAALHIPASLSSIINSTSPLFGSMLAVVLLGERLRPGRWLGIALGMAGVALIANPSAIGTVESSATLAVLAGLSAAALYGFAAVLARKFAHATQPQSISAWSQVLAGLALLPLVPFAPPQEVTWSIAALTVLYSVLCSAFAYLLYYRLILNIGATRTMMVSFLSPVFGVAAGVLLLGETVGLLTLAGSVLILTGLSLVLRR